MAVASEARPPARVLLAGAPHPLALAIMRLFEDTGFEMQSAATLDEALERLKRVEFDLWMLHHQGLSLGEPYVWASLRYARELGGYSHADEPGAPKSAKRYNALILIPEGSTETAGILRTATETPCLIEGPPWGWNFGVQEVPFKPEHLRALAFSLLDDAGRKADIAAFEVGPPAPA